MPTDRAPLPDVQAELSSAGIVLVMRRMRAPLITLIVIFAISMLGLTLAPGRDVDGHVQHLTVFEAFYFMSYTATTIGYGELPHSFTPEQRMWVTVAIFLSVVGWAYTVGSMLALVQDHAFRRALKRRGFAREVRRIAEPFVLIVGYGHAGRMLARSLDEMGRRYVVLDEDEDRVQSVELDDHRVEVPVLQGNARDTGDMVLGGLGHANCEGVIALTGDDETNLDVTMTTALVRPDLPVIARSSSRRIGERMEAFHPEVVINPLDRFGDHLRILLRSPASYQLMIWLTSAPGTPLPERRGPVTRGHWVVYGYEQFGHELTEDLRAEGIDVTVIEDTEVDPPADLVRAADAFVAATTNDTTNLWLAEWVHRTNPDAYVVAMENQEANGPLYDQVGVAFGMLPAEVIAHEVMARIANPVLMRFLPQVPRQGEEWASATVERLVETCGGTTPYLWGVALTHEQAPGILEWVEAGEVTVGDLLRNPRDRTHPLPAMALTHLRGEERTMTPESDLVLEPGDRLLIAGSFGARGQLDSTLFDHDTATYVLDGRLVPSGWLWRRMSGEYAGRRR